MNANDTSLSVNELILRAASGDGAAVNVLDMIDANEQGARSATEAQLGAWYAASIDAERDREAEAARVKQHDEYMRRVSEQRARDRALLAPAIAACRALGVTIDDDGDVERAPSADLSVEDEFMQVSSFRRTRTGKRIIVVGRRYSVDGSQAVRFPLRKSGTYNIERIAALVKERADAARDAAERKRVVMDAAANAAALANEVRADLPTRFACRIESVVEHRLFDGVNAHGRVHVQTPVAGKVFLNLGRLQLTPEQVARVVAALNAVLPGDEL